MVISYEIYETSLRRVSLISYEMTTSSSVRFCLSYDHLKLNFIDIKINIIIIRKRAVDTDVFCDVYVYAPKCYYTCDDMTLSTE